MIKVICCKCGKFLHEVKDKTNGVSHGFCQECAERELKKFRIQSRLNKIQDEAKSISRDIAKVYALIEQIKVNMSERKIQFAIL